MGMVPSQLPLWHHIALSVAHSMHIVQQEGPVWGQVTRGPARALGGVWGTQCGAHTAPYSCGNELACLALRAPSVFRLPTLLPQLLLRSQVVGSESSAGKEASPRWRLCALPTYNPHPAAAGGARERRPE